MSVAEVYLPLTEEELVALDKLAEAIGAIKALPLCHAADITELVPHFHAIQEKIMARAAVRAYPNLFTHLRGFE